MIKTIGLKAPLGGEDFGYFARNETRRSRLYPQQLYISASGVVCGYFGKCISMRFESAARIRLFPGEVRGRW
jgi:hypothetical protein